MSEFSSLKRGDHACLFYESKREQALATAAYLKPGFSRNERCFFTGDPAAVDLLRTFLEEAGVDVDAQIRRGALILTSERPYLVDGVFHPPTMLSFVWNAIESAKTAGFVGLRGAGDVVWELGPGLDYNSFLEYEKILDTLKHADLTAFCQYDRQVIPTRYLNRSLLHHFWVAAGPQKFGPSPVYEYKNTGA